MASIEVRFLNPQLNPHFHWIAPDFIPNAAKGINAYVIQVKRYASAVGLLPSIRSSVLGAPTT